MVVLAVDGCASSRGSGTTGWCSSNASANRPGQDWGPLWAGSDGGRTGCDSHTVSALALGDQSMRQSDDTRGRSCRRHTPLLHSPHACVRCGACGGRVDQQGQHTTTTLRSRPSEPVRGQSSPWSGGAGIQTHCCARGEAIPGAQPRRPWPVLLSRAGHTHVRRRRGGVGRG